LHVTLPFIPLLAAIGSYKAVNSSFHGGTLFLSICVEVLFVNLLQV